MTLQSLPHPLRALCAELSNLSMPHITLVEQYAYHLRVQRMEHDPRGAREELAEFDRQSGELLRLTV